MFAQTSERKHRSKHHHEVKEWCAKTETDVFRRHVESQRKQANESETTQNGRLQEQELRADFARRLAQWQGESRRPLLMVSAWQARAASGGMPYRSTSDSSCEQTK